MTAPTPPMPLTPQDALALFRRDTEQIVDRLADVDPTAPVPTCPGWTIADLIVHLGGVHGWVCQAIVTGERGGRPTPPARTDAETLQQWYDDQARTLADLLQSTDPEQAVWHFGPKPRVARFWFTRQAHEVAIHRYDLAAAAGDVPPLPDEAAAIDGIDEIVRLIYPGTLRNRGTEEADPGITVRTGDHQWVLGKRPTAELSGPASVLQPTLWGRISPDDSRLSITGDAEVVRGLLASGLVP